MMSDYVKDIIQDFPPEVRRYMTIFVQSALLLCMLRKWKDSPVRYIVE